jgi:hypothetical protein
MRPAPDGDKPSGAGVLATAQAITTFAICLVAAGAVLVDEDQRNWSDSGWWP